MPHHFADTVRALLNSSPNHSITIDFVPYPDGDVFTIKNVHPDLWDVVGMGPTAPEAVDDYLAKYKAFLEREAADIASTLSKIP